MERLKKLKQISNEILFWIITFVVTVVLFITVKPHLHTELGWARKGVVAQSVAGVIIFLVVIVALFLSAYKKLNAKTITICLIIIGFALRVGYMLITPAATRQHDTFTKNFDGHEAYAWTIYSTNRLPKTNIYQFYHPPLNALFQAGFMHFFSGLTDLLTTLFGLGDYFATEFLIGKPDYIDGERFLLYSSCQILSVMYSMVACVYSIKIIKAFGFSNKVNLLLYAFVILFPRNIQISAQLNNDTLSYTLSILALFTCVKWFKCGKKHLYIYLCAIFAGLGMMTKLSSATICLPIAVVFIYEFIRSIVCKKDIGKIICQYIIFLIICAPIGLWFQVYAKIKFDQNFGFVFSNLNGELSTKQHSIFSRFIFASDLEEWFGSLFAMPFDHYNLFLYLTRTSVFGEFSYWQGESFGLVALASAYLACGVIIIDIIYCLIALIVKRAKKQITFKAIFRKFGDILFMVSLILSQVVSMYYFYIKMPYGCTMDFRYILPMILGLALGLGYIFKTFKLIGGNTAKILTCSTLALIVVFITSSAGFYMMCV